jgi:hypothetical protein
MPDDGTRSAIGLMMDVAPATFLQAALAENRRLMAQLDPRLPKPVVMPALATSLLVAIRMLPPRKQGALESGRRAA